MGKVARKTVQQRIDLAVEEALAKERATNGSKTVTCSTFTGVQFDAEAVGAIDTIAEGLVCNAQALGALASVLKASNVTIESLLKL